MSQGRVSSLLGFNQEDDDTLIRFIAEKNPDWRGRKGVKLYKRLVNETTNGSRHTWKSWQHRYVDHCLYFDERIEEYQLKHGISLPEASSKPSARTLKRKFAFTEEEDALLIAYIAKNDTNGKRKGLQLYDTLAKHDGKVYGRSSKAWCHRYSKNADYIDFKVQEYQRKRRLTVIKPVDSIHIQKGDSENLSVQSSSRFRRTDDENLAAYLANNTSSPEDRRSLRTYKRLTDRADLPWAATRTAYSWMNRYQANVAYFESLILNKIEQSGRSSRPVSGKKKKHVRFSSLDIEAGGSSESTPISARERQCARFHSPFLEQDSVSGVGRSRRGDSCRGPKDLPRKLRQTRSHTRMVQTVGASNNRSQLVSCGIQYDEGNDSEEEVALVDAYLREVDSESDSDCGLDSVLPQSTSSLAPPVLASRSRRMECVSITKSSKSNRKL